MGVYHPKPGYCTNMKMAQCGYNNRTRQMLVRDLQTKNIPITVEHKGFDELSEYITVYPTAERVGALLDAHPDTTKRPVGIVFDRFELPDGRFLCSYAIDPYYTEVLNDIKNGTLTGLSLSDAPISPDWYASMEITLTADPARPGCNIIKHFKTRKDTELYKRVIILTAHVRRALAMATDTKSADDPISAINGIPDDQMPVEVKAIVNDGFTTFINQEKSTRAELDRVRAEFEAHKLATAERDATDRDMMNAALEELFATSELDASNLERYKTAQWRKMVESEQGAPVRTALRQVAVMASSTIARLRQEQRSSTSKRTAQDAGFIPSGSTDTRLPQTNDINTSSATTSSSILDANGFAARLRQKYRLDQPLA